MVIVVDIDEFVLTKNKKKKKFKKKTMNWNGILIQNDGKLLILSELEKN